jgi:hypothetical protein
MYDDVTQVKCSRIITIYTADLLMNARTASFEVPLSLSRSLARSLAVSLSLALALSVSLSVCLGLSLSLSLSRFLFSSLTL